MCHETRFSVIMRNRAVGEEIMDKCQIYHFPSKSLKYFFPKEKKMFLSFIANKKCFSFLTVKDLLGESPFSDYDTTVF